MLDMLRSALCTWPIYVIYKFFLSNFVPMWLYISTILAVAVWYDSANNRVSSRNNLEDKPDHHWRNYYCRYKSACDFLTGMFLFKMFGDSVWILLTIIVSIHILLIFLAWKNPKLTNVVDFLPLYKKVTDLIWFLLVTIMEFTFLCCSAAYLVTWGALSIWISILFGIVVTQAAYYYSGLSGLIVLIFIIWFWYYVVYLACVEFKNKLKINFPKFLRYLEITIASSLSVDSDVVKLLIINRKRKLLIQQKEAADAKHRRLNKSIVARLRREGLRLTQLETIRLQRNSGNKRKPK